MGHAVIGDVRLITLPHHTEENGELVVIEQGVSMPFSAPRMFAVRAPVGAIRGEHAHKHCSQFLVSVHGTIEVRCDDGSEKKTFVLETPSTGLLIPPSIWARQTYVTPGAVLTVLCDRPYEAADYLRDYAQFIVWRSSSSPGPHDS